MRKQINELHQVVGALAREITPALKAIQSGGIGGILGLIRGK